MERGGGGARIPGMCEEKGFIKSGYKSGYRRLEQRLGGSFWRVQIGWRAVWGLTEAVGRADRHFKKGEGVPLPSFKRNPAPPPLQ